MSSDKKHPLLEGKCSYYDGNPLIVGTPRHVIDIFDSGHVFHKLPYKKVILVCPVCGRRVQARSVVCHDNCCVSYVMPIHKPKKWWKKNKKDKKSVRRKKERRSTIR